jgi:uncharacterized membrane protein YkvA (DUF1232 family)
LLRQARLVWRLLRDSRVSSWAKSVPFASLIYLLSPIDLLPDLMLPGFGQLDDLAVILLSIKVFVNLCPPAVVAEHLEQLTGRTKHRRGTEPSPSGPTIDAPYRVLDPEKE